MADPCLCSPTVALPLTACPSSHKAVSPGTLTKQRPLAAGSHCSLSWQLNCGSSRSAKAVQEEVPGNLQLDLLCPGHFSGAWACSSFSFHTRFYKSCVCKHQTPSRCLQGTGLKAREGSKRRQTVLRGYGVRSPPGRGHALQLKAAVAGVTYSTSRSQHYFVAP